MLVISRNSHGNVRKMKSFSSGTVTLNSQMLLDFLLKMFTVGI